jgi:catechol 2,3-dioxygenase-like lactoylglutathione lyase family enzyme
MAILGFEHVSFVVRDIERSVRFWTEALGFRETSRGPFNSPAMGRLAGLAGADALIVFVSRFGLQLELIEYRAPGGRTGDVAMNDSQASHIAFRVDDAAAEAARLVAAGATMVGGVEYLPDDPNDLCWCAYLRDPNGIVFELIQPVKPAA